jgi:hypothetical protein
MLFSLLWVEQARRNYRRQLPMTNCTINFFPVYGDYAADFDSFAGRNFLLTPLLNNIYLADSLHFLYQRKVFRRSLDSLYLKVSTATQDITSFVANYLGGIRLLRDSFI